ncbi:Protein of unknown function [Pseudarcicella hirudinis]|uniref:Outer membrane protein beta-barrel domain-containing protein n=1 Tax=Pseudarcicella hirudinis TaxID=1079859 RepID=A0A1I5MRK1_9BACT|nr:DUF3575 domain-containing protein [Pseudarcicella hirudinis]SFP11566.1 Protein of unknown function [Pseudarcicella hirudinis]
MKKLLLCLSIISAVNCVSNAQIIKIAPVTFAFGIINAGYEKQLTEKSSIFPSASIYARSGVSGIGLGLQYRRYLSASKSFPAGFFFAPEVQYGSFKQKDSNDYSYSAYSLGAQIGYQWALGDNFTIETSIGPAYWFTSASKNISITYDGPLPSIGFNLGYNLGR